jgi:hypothetical protein
VSDALENLTGDIDSLPGKIEAVRERGYAFASYLEHKANVMASQWMTLRSQILDALHQEAQRLQSEVGRLRMPMQMAEGMRGNPAALGGQLPNLDRALDSVESALRAAQSRLEAMYSTLENDTSTTLKQLEDITWYLDQWDEASFDALAEEALFLAAKAEWVEKGKSKDDPDGIVYLTDQRLIFEQKETTGKTLGLFGGKKVQELEWSIPLHQIEGVTAENKGLFGGKDMLNFTLGQGAPFLTLVIEVKGGVASKFWAAQIQRMISGKTDDERAIQPDEETLEAIRNAPTACPSCGGTLPMLVAGERQVECPYCGTIIRV